MINATVQLTIHCDASGCRAKTKATGHIGVDGRVHVRLPGAWRHAPVVTFCPKHMRLRRDAHKRNGTKETLTWTR